MYYQILTILLRELYGQQLGELVKVKWRTKLTLQVFFNCTSIVYCAGQQGSVWSTIQIQLP